MAGWTGTKTRVGSGVEDAGYFPPGLEESIVEGTEAVRGRLFFFFFLWRGKALEG